MKLIINTLICCMLSFSAAAQNFADTSKWSYHFQLTVINQAHPAFKALYTGNNSLGTASDEALSLTTTLFLGRQLWKGASVYLNPEIAGGSGFNGARGVAGFTNGETFRIGNPAPALYLGRLFYRQHIALSNKMDTLDAGINQLSEIVPSKRITITAGKFSMADIFDNNAYSHDPRTQFMNWSLMSSGAWDYAANTRGYTDALAIEYITPTWAIRLATALEPKAANGPDFDYHYFKSHAETFEVQRNLKIGKRQGVIRLLAYRNENKAPVYKQVTNDFITGADTALDVINGKKYGNVKYGFGINAEQQVTNDLGLFLRAGWNDGKTATWAFTEIDRSFSVGLNYTGSKWNRPNDNLGLAVVSNGISKDHQDFLRAGGYGFIIGDGKLLRYRAENIMEVYYQVKLNTTLSISADYQFVQNPAYNADRGPVNVFSARVHIAI